MCQTVLSVENNAGEGKREAGAGWGGMLQLYTEKLRKASPVKGLESWETEVLMHLKRTGKGLYQDENIQNIPHILK